MYIHVYHKTWNHETMKPSWNMKPCHSTWIFFLITVWLPSCIFSIFIWNLMARTYHQRFGIHLAMLKKEMGEANWKAACWLVIFLFSWLDCGAGPSRTSSFAGLRCTENGCGAFQGLHCHFSFWFWWSVFAKRKSTGPRLMSGMMSGTWIAHRCRLAVFFGNFLLRRMQWRQSAT